ncbi:MAG: hypothetical protein RI947_522 [Candidatus Parcubacteria bacterium]|jgi:hypothetical protein
MRKTIFAFLVLITFLVLANPPAHAYEGDHSAVLVSSPIVSTAAAQLQDAGYHRKKAAIKKVLESYNSPMVGSVDAFMDACIKYDLDCYLLPSIAGLESTFGQFTWPGSNNPFGWGRGLITFKDWNESIDTVGQGLRENYINKGATTIAEIGSIYCEGNTWAGRVRTIRSMFEAEEAKNQLFFSADSVKL